MKEGIRNLLAEFKTGLEGIYGDRLKGVYLFGSYARGDEDAESDIDVLVVLDQVDHYGVEIDRSGHLVSDLSLKYGVSISRVFVPHRDWSVRDTSFLANARDEAVPV